MMVVCPALYGQTTLNNILSTYSTNIKVCNAPYATNCIYDKHYMRVNKQDNFINIEYGFGWDEKRGYITTNRISINLSTVTFYTGYWYNSFGKWENLGKKNELTIEDENGIDLYITGQQNYNQGTKQNCVSLIKFDFGTEPIANQVLKELLALQETYKGEAPWLLPFTSKNKDNINTPESTIDFVKDDFKSKHIKNIFFKEDKWSFEKEYRLHKMWSVDVTNDERNISLPSSCIMEIILGKYISEESEKEIIEIVRENYPNIKIIKR